MHFCLCGSSVGSSESETFYLIVTFICIYFTVGLLSKTFEISSSFPSYKTVVFTGNWGLIFLFRAYLMFANRHLAKVN